jgi:Fur family zinc uptake transcriptional regulator
MAKHRHSSDSAAVAAACQARGLRFTALRRAVYEIVATAGAPLGAYDILGRLAEGGRRAAPITVYRALDFLVANGFVHRIASRNAFVICDHVAEPHAAQFLICEDCGRVEELHDSGLFRAVEKSAGSHGYAVEQPLIEIPGRCPDCRPDGGRD